MVKSIALIDMEEGGRIVQHLKLQENPQFQERKSKLFCVHVGPGVFEVPDDYIEFSDRSVVELLQKENRTLNRK